MSYIIYRIPRLHCMSPSHIYSRNGRRHPSILHISHHNHCYPYWHQSIQLTSYTAWRNHQMRSPNTMSIRFYFPLHYRRPYRYCPSKLLPRYCPTRYILRSCSLPLCPFNGSRLCHPRRIHPLIPPVNRIYLTSLMDQSSLWSNIYRSQFNLLPTALPRPSWYASTIL